MDTASLLPTSTAAPSVWSSQADYATQQNALEGSRKSGEKSEVAEKFADTFGELLYGEMMKALRKSVPKNGYFHGGQTEEVFQQQLDQLVVQEMTKATDLTRDMDAVFNSFKSY